MFKNAFPTTGQFFRGNLHMHTTNSDGKLTPEEARDAYQDAGYDFICLSDHHTYHDTVGLSNDKIMILPGIEIDFKMPKGDFRCFHLNLFPSPEAKATKYGGQVDGQHYDIPPFTDIACVNEVIDDFHKAGWLVMFNHPNWSTVEWEDIVQLKNCFAMEIINHSTNYLESIGMDVVVWDAVSRRGAKLFCTATDDSHNRAPLTSPYSDSFGGWVMVKAASCTHADIWAALKAGHFYATTGPEIHELTIEDGIVNVTCSSCERIHLIGQTRQSQTVIGARGHNSLTKASFQLRGNEDYIRIECVDMLGERAYSQIMYLR